MLAKFAWGYNTEKEKYGMIKSGIVDPLKALVKPFKVVDMLTMSTACIVDAPEDNIETWKRLGRRG